MNSAACISIILGCCVLWVACSFPVALSCDSCGRECASACGTRHFRTCCFNYLRKRSSIPPIGPAGTDRRAEQRYSMKSAQHPRTGQQHLTDILINNADGDIDYEYIPIVGTNRLSLAGSDPVPRSSSIGEPFVHSPELDESRSVERNNDKTPEETQPGRLQLLYES